MLNKLVDRNGTPELYGLIEPAGWAEDVEQRLHPVRLTHMFHRSVPVLKHLDWSILETGFGSAVTVLPLNVQSSNQHIAHQAAVILIAADYTGGIAAASCLTCVPVVGICPQIDDNAAYLWGAKAEIKWIRPSTDDLVCRASLDERQIRRIRERYFSGKRVLETVEIGMFNGTEQVAAAAVTYWIQDTAALRKNAIDADSIHVLYDHKTKVSAKLIAGLRALEQRRPSGERLFDDATAESAAGKHGITIAERFSGFAPQLQRMVAARTHVLDRLVSRLDPHRPWQVVNIGAGLDTRFSRIRLPAGSKIFHLDLPHMIRLRNETIAVELPDRTFFVPFDIHESSVADALGATGEFDRTQPSLFIWEGGSMYFDRPKTKALLQACRPVMNEHALLWMDFVDRRVVDGSHSDPVVRHFISEMRSFGEPFVCGYDDMAAFLGECGLRAREIVKSSMFADESIDVFDSYSFVTAGAKPEPAGSGRL